MATKKGFCKNCYTKFLIKWDAKNRDKRGAVDVDDLIFKCKFPIFTTNSYGEPMVKIWNCKTQIYNEYPNAKYLKLRSEGLMP